MKQHRKNNDSVSDVINKNKKSISYIFLGIGLTLFMLNIASILSFATPGTYSFTPFDLSIFGSMILIIAATYMIHYD